MTGVPSPPSTNQPFAMIDSPKYSRRSTGDRLRLLALASVLAACSASAADPEDPLDIAQLKKFSVDELMDIQVTSVSKHAEKLSEAPSAIQVITGDEIRRSGASSIPEALRLASNLHVAQQDSRQWAISARGFNNGLGNKMLVLIDGRTVYTPLFSGVFWDVQDTLLEDVDRIEVISGPGATLWGANAVNGVINIITRRASESQGLYLEGGGGTELRGFGGFRYGGEFTSNVFYRVYAKHTRRDHSETSADTVAGDDWWITQGGFRVDWEASEFSLMTFQGDLYDGQISQAAPGDVGVSGGNVLARLTHSYADETEIQLQMYYDRAERRIPGTFTENLNTFDVDFQHRLPLGGRHDFMWGLGYRLLGDDVRNGPGLAFRPETVTLNLFTAFLQDEITLIEDRLSLTLGSKFEHNDFTGFEIQPSARLSHLIDDKQMVWGAVSRAVRTPSRLDRDFFIPGTAPFAILGGPNFESESLVAYELGYRVRPREDLSVSAAAFFNDYSGIRGTEQTAPPAPAPMVIENSQDAEAYGVELSAKYQASESWQLRAGFTELQVRVRAKRGSTDTTRGSGEAVDPNHQFFLRSSHNLSHNVELDAGFRYVSRLASQNVPAYAELDLRLGWRPTDHLEVSLVGRNLLHESHAEFGARAGRREIERSVYGKLAWRF